MAEAVEEKQEQEEQSKEEERESVRPDLQRRFEEELRQSLKEQLSIDNIMAVPKLTKITVNMGLGDVSDNRDRVEWAVEDLTRITGQKPVVTTARRSIAGFHIREGDPVGVKVTLRGARMYSFLERLIKVVIPRIKDFRGLDPASFDGRGNFSMGITEQVTFPVMDVDQVRSVQGLDICITTTAENDEQGLALLTELGMPFQNV